jgi:hypothetical protein
VSDQKERCPLPAASIRFVLPAGPAGGAELFTYRLIAVLLLRSAGAAAHSLEVFEEVRAGIHHHHVVTVLEAGAVGFQAAVELVELRILAEGLGVDLDALASPSPRIFSDSR